MAAQTLEERRSMNALIVETAFPGDVVISLALAHALKQAEPSSRITYLVRPDAASIPEHSPHVDAVLVYDKRGSERGLTGIRQKSKELKSHEFTHVFLLQSSPRNLELARQLQASTIVGFRSLRTSTVLTHAVEEPVFGTARTSRAISLLQPLLHNVDASLDPVLDPPPLDVAWQYASRWSSTVAIAPGSAWATKQWGFESYARLIERLMAADLGVMVIGGSGERQVFDLIDPHCRDRVLNLAGQTSFVEAAAAIREADLLIGNDSAPLHLASAVSTTSLAIFGPTVPEFGFVPRNARAIGLPELWCRPCSAHGDRTCPVYTHACMQEISVDRVFNEAMTFLKLPSPSLALGA